MFSVMLSVHPDLMDQRPVPWALGRLADAVAAAGGTTVTDEPADVVVRIDTDGSGGAEAFTLLPNDNGVVVRGSDARGAAYGITELADRLRHADDADAVWRLHEQHHAPATPVRAILRAFSSDALDLDWFRDPRFWTAYLDHLAENRVNRVQLALGMQYNYSHDPGVYDNYFTFAYPFLLDVPGWRARARGVDAAEQRRNLEALRFASEQAAERGIDFFLGLWNHALNPELEPNPNVRYPISGLDAADIPAYSARALEALLQECPDIAGLTFRVHYEGGVHETIRSAFWTTVFEGVARSGRGVKIDMHAKGVDGDLIAAARSARGEITLSAKYWAEHAGLPYHQARVRDMERARPADTDSLAGVTHNTRRFTRYGYGDFLGDDRQADLIFRIWPGTQRFLLWADPVLFSGYGQHATLAGAKGAELAEPLTFRGRKNSGHGPRDLYVDPALHQSASDDWRKYALTYRLWGRLLYNPAADPDEWRRWLRASFGPASGDLESALSNAGRILPLTTVALGISASNNFWWPELPTNLTLEPQRGGIYEFDTPEPYSWGAVSPFDPETFASTNEYVASLVAGEPTGKLSPLAVADRLDRLARDAMSGCERAGDADDPAHRRIRIDVFLVAHLGRMYARRLRAGVQFELYRRDGDPTRMAATLRHLEDARSALSAVVDAADGVYFRDLAFGDRPTERGSWRDRLAQLDDELADLRARYPVAAEPVAEDPVDRRGPAVELTLSATTIETGEVLLRAADAPADATIVFHHRPLHQGREWRSADGVTDAGDLVCTVDVSADDARYPLQWYVTIRLPDRPPVNLPALDDAMRNAPYLLHPASASRGA